jgi:hypothetical protein
MLRQMLNLPHSEKDKIQSPARTYIWSIQVLWTPMCYAILPVSISAESNVVSRPYSPRRSWQQNDSLMFNENQCKMQLSCQKDFSAFLYCELCENPSTLLAALMRLLEEA